MMLEAPSRQPDAASSDDRNSQGGRRPSTGDLLPARLGRSLRGALRVIWDRIGVILLLSLLGTTTLLLGLTLGLLVPHALPGLLRTFCIGVFIAVTLSPLAAVSFDVALRIATHREVSISDCVRGLRQFGSIAIRLGLLHLVVAAAMALNVNFYVHLGGVAGGAAVVLCLYLALLWGAMALYQGPLLILQETGAFDEPDRPAKRGVKAVIRRSFFLVVGEPLFSLGLCAAVLVWSLLALLTAVGAAMLWLGGACVLTTVPTLALLQKYGVVDSAESNVAAPTKEA